MGGYLSNKRHCLPGYFLKRARSTLLHVSHCSRGYRAKGSAANDGIAERWMGRMRQSDGPINSSKFLPIPDTDGRTINVKYESRDSDFRAACTRESSSVYHFTFNLHP